MVPGRLGSLAMAQYQNGEIEKAKSTLAKAQVHEERNGPGNLEFVTEAAELIQP